MDTITGTVSVLMSVYNSERPEYLNRSLQSVWDDQTFKPIQIILIKDGPLGYDLEKIVDLWCERIPDIMTIINNVTNLGLTKSLNRGLKVVKGDLIARMDSDDISMPRRFEQQVKFLVEHHNISVIGGWLQEFDDNNSCLNIRRYPTDPIYIRKYICKASPLAHPTVMMRRELFTIKGHHYNEKYRTTQDLALWFDVLSAGEQISNLQEVTIKFRRAGDVFKRRSRSKAINEFKIYIEGIYRLYGCKTWRYIYPSIRLIFRLLPLGVISRIYGSSIRALFLNSQNARPL